MRRLLVLLFPVILPLAVRWARKQEEMILASGEGLDDQGLADAKRMGISHPERIRVLVVDKVCGPRNLVLAKAAELTGLFNPFTGGVSYRYGIQVRTDCAHDRMMIAHECVHTAQYERLGGFTPFLRQYLRECLFEGYPGGSLEQEAIARSNTIESGA